ncbi:choice-of-anchor D domain-containing protein, partial [Candidatus Poribacteria bacterium]|nr:choice-of-anchor D domain-containing protein [Candidatus Poribacteria bacterium]
MDGIAVGSETNGSFGELHDSAATLRMGASSVLGQSGYFTGDMDDVAIWSVARTQAEILADANGGITGVEANLVGYWDLDDGVAADLTANANGGTIGGGPSFFDVPVAVLSSPNLDFGTVDTGVTSAVQSFTITNLGTMDLVVTDVNATDATRYAITGTTSFTLAGGATSGALDVTFTPDAVGTFDAQVVIDHDGRGLSSVSVSGVGQQSFPAGPNALVLDGATDGTGDYVLVPDSPLLDLNTFTIEAWVNWDGVSPFATVLSRPRADTPSPAGSGYVLRVTPTDWFFGFSNGANYTVTDPNPVIAGVWTHLAGTFDGQVLHGYVNGELTVTNDLGGPQTLLDSTAALLIGREFIGGIVDRTFGGELDEVRLWGDARTQAEIQSAMHVSLTGSESDLVGYWDFDDGTANDRGLNGLDGTLTDGATLTASDARVGPADRTLVLDGIDDHAVLPDSALYNFAAAAPFAVSFWMKPDAVQLDTTLLVTTVLGKGTHTSGAFPFLFRYANATDPTYPGTVEVARFDGATSPAVVSTTSLNDGAWHHVTAVSDGSTLTLYVDGVSEGTASEAGLGATGNASGLYAGIDSDALYPFSGSVDEIRIWDGWLTDAEVAADMTALAPVAPSNGGASVAQWSFDNGYVEDVSGSGIDGTLVNGATTTVQPVASVSVASLDFGPTEPGTPSAAQSFTITNPGITALVVTDVSATDATRYAVTGRGAPYTLFAGDPAESYDVTFTPDAVGTFDAQVTIAHDGRGLGAASVTGAGETAITVPTGDLNDTKIVFAQAVNGSTQDIFVRDSDGTLTNLTDNPTVHETAPVWSPDGTQIAFSGKASGNQDIWRMDFDAATNTVSNFVQLTTHTTADWNPEWSPLGGEIAFHSSRTGSTDIFKVTTDGLTETQLTFDAAEDARVSWSPDGTEIAYASTRGVGGEEDLFIIPAAGDDTTPTQVTATADEEIYPEWSPDGTKLVFQARPVGGLWDLYTIGVDGTGLTALTIANSPSYHENRPDWSPDGTRIVYDSDPDGDSELYAVNADNTGVVDQLTSNSVTDSSPDWSPFFPAAPVADQALTFDGSTSYVDMGDAAALKITGPLTIETWFRTTQAVGNYITLMGKWHSGGSNASYGLSWRDADGLVFIINDNTNAVVSAASGQFYNDALWHHAAGVWDGTDARLYVDGDLVGSVTGGGAPVSDTTLPFILGSDAVLDFTRFFQGDLDEARVWNVARTPDEIRATMNVPPVNTDPGLVAHWDFDDGTATDLSLSGINGTLSATTATPIASAQFDVPDLAFGVTDVGAPSSALTFTVTNTGAEAMLVNGFTPSAPTFTVTAPGTPLPLNAGDVSSAVSVTLTPDQVGVASGRVTIDHDARGPRFVTLSGLGRIDPPVGDLLNTKIVFAQEVNGTNQDIFVRDADGTVTNLTNNPTVHETTPVWSPDGTQIAYSAKPSGNEDIWRLDFDPLTNTASNFVQLTTDVASDWNPAWSPVGDEIAFHSARTGLHDLFKVTVDGATETQLTFNAAADTFAAWSPDGSQIAYASTRGVGGVEDLFVIAAAGDDSTPAQVTATADEETHAEWSPDGTQLAFQSRPVAGIWDLYLIGADGTGLTPLTVANTPAFDESRPSWSPDGTRIVYDSDADGDPELYAVSADNTGAVEQFTINSLTDKLPAWSPFLPAAPVADQALTFDGSTSYVDMGDAAALKIAGPLTIETWFRIVQAPTSFTTLMGKWFDGSNDAAYALSFTDADGLRFVINDATNTSVIANSGLTLDDTLWHHAAGVWDGTQALLYVDGDLLASTTGPGAAIFDTTRPFILGSDSTLLSDRFFGGDLDEARVWNVARTRDEIRATMNVPPVNTDPGLVAHWDFDDGTA